MVSVSYSCIVTTGYLGIELCNPLSIYELSSGDFLKMYFQVDISFENVDAYAAKKDKICADV